MPRGRRNRLSRSAPGFEASRRGETGLEAVKKIGVTEQTDPPPLTRTSVGRGIASDPEGRRSGPLVVTSATTAHTGHGIRYKPGSSVPNNSCVRFRPLFRL